MILKLISPEKTHFDGEVSSVGAPGTNGRNFVILNDYAPTISALDKGTVKYTHEGVVDTLEIEGGFIEICDNVIVICAEINS